jgi:hypothetical protein
MRDTFDIATGYRIQFNVHMDDSAPNRDSLIVVAHFDHSRSRAMCKCGYAALAHFPRLREQPSSPVWPRRNTPIKRLNPRRPLTVLDGVCQVELSAR